MSDGKFWSTFFSGFALATSMFGLFYVVDSLSTVRFINESTKSLNESSQLISNLKADNEKLKVENEKLFNRNVNLKAKCDFFRSHLPQDICIFETIFGEGK